MFNIFKRKKKPESITPRTRPIEKEISQIINRYTGKRLSVKKSDFMHFSKELSNLDNSIIFSIASACDRFSLSIFMRHELTAPSDFIKELNELTRMEILQYPYKKEFYEAELWAVSGSEIFSNEDFDYFITRDEFRRDISATDSLEIGYSREFAFGQTLINRLYINQSPVAVSYNNMLFSEHTHNTNTFDSFFQSSVLIDGKEIRFYYLLKGNSNITSTLTKSFIKEQKIQLEKALKKKVKILSAGQVDPEEVTNYSGYTLQGNIHTSGADIPYELLFPRKLINLYPDYICSTIKGKILQINKELFRSGFSDFYKPMKNFLITDFLSIADDRDLNLICQNFFLTNSIHGDDIRKLFFYKIKLAEKSKIQREPFISADRFFKHLPRNLKEEFQLSKAYSQSYRELIQGNQKILNSIFRQISEKKLLLSYGAQTILNKELGARAKESKTLRLRKLIGDKRYINYLARLDSKKVQILFSTMKNVLIIDTLIYQTDELIKLKPYLSKTRFDELRADISYTQGKIKSNQIDINRICDSIEKFNLFIKEFVKKEQKGNV